MTLHLSYEIIFHVGGLKLAVIDIASSRLKVIQFFPDNRKIAFYVSSSCPSEISKKLDSDFTRKTNMITELQVEMNLQHLIVTSRNLYMLREKC